MEFIALSALFFVTGVLSILYYNAVPSESTLRQRLPNKASAAGIILFLVMVAAGWFIATRTSGFIRIASITTMLFVLLDFESVFLLLIRWLKSNLTALLATLVIVIIPFVIQYYAPSFILANLLIMLATLGATTLIIRLNLIRGWVLLLIAGLFAVNDVLNVTFLVPHLHLVEITQPLPLLVFPTVTVGKHVVGSGDFMFLVLTTVSLLRDFGKRSAYWLVGLESIALLITGPVVAYYDILFPFLTVMAPIFFLVYWISWKRRKHSPALTN